MALSMFIMQATNGRKCFGECKKSGTCRTCVVFFLKKNKDNFSSVLFVHRSVVYRQSHFPVWLLLSFSVYLRYYEFFGVRPLTSTIFLDILKTLNIGLTIILVDDTQ